MWKKKFLIIIFLLIILVNFSHADKCCPKCKAKYKDNVNFCPQCGVRLKPVTIKKSPPLPKEEPKIIKLTTLNFGPGVIEIESNPNSVSVYLNDEFMGYTPFKTENLAGGRYILKLTHPNFEDYIINVEIPEHPRPKSTKDLAMAIAQVQINDRFIGIMENIERLSTDRLTKAIENQNIFAEVVPDLPLSSSYDLRLVLGITNVTELPSYRKVLDKQRYNSAQNEGCFRGSLLGGVFTTTATLLAGGKWLFLITAPVGLIIGGITGRTNVNPADYRQSELEYCDISIAIEYQCVDKARKEIYKGTYSVSDKTRNWEEPAPKMAQKIANDFVQKELSKIKDALKEYYKWK